ncbi:hypothetical protein [Nocardioides sp. CER19]|uniref:hypothetical protein n=1 Tax=Nocardioides sp. CER19 TaxID=3038538 RepID=UPI00244D7CBD|nr:hypothetical protein [Nocardioides sp. CER19]MDH2413684.1 hypothetical protein [Nocardioides sp. CER19]
MLTTTKAPRVRAALAALVGAALLGGCAVTGGSPGARHEAAAQGAAQGAADEWMPAAPASAAAWLADVGHIYDTAVGGGSAEAWLRQRMAHRRPGERLAVVLGIDDVMLQTHFAGLNALVPRSVRFVRTAHALGYSVFYVTGRSYGTGLGDVESTIERANVPANAFYGRPLGAKDDESAKAECRAAIEHQGYTLAMSVAASEVSFDGAPAAEKEVRLPDFAVTG